MFRCTSCGALNRVAADHPGTPVCGKCKETLDVSGAPQEVDAEGFARAIAASPIPVVVDFWAPWCGPCRFAAPIFEQYGRANRGKVLMLKINTDQHPGPSQRFMVRGIPTFIVFKDGAEVARQAGTMPLPDLTRFLAPYVETRGTGAQV